VLTRCTQEAQKSEVTLLDDDPDAVEAVLRHLYNFTLEPPTDEEIDKLRYYCNVVVASDKYGVLGLVEEAALHLTSHLVNTEAPQTSLPHSRSSPKNTATTNRSRSAYQVSSRVARRSWRLFLTLRSWSRRTRNSLRQSSRMRSSSQICNLPPDTAVISAVTLSCPQGPCSRCVVEIELGALVPRTSQRETEGNRERTSQKTRDAQYHGHHSWRKSALQVMPSYTHH
jgi:hypothetical protein